MAQRRLPQQLRNTASASGADAELSRTSLVSPKAAVADPVVPRHWAGREADAVGRGTRGAAGESLASFGLLQHLEGVLSQAVLTTYPQITGVG